MKTLITFLLLTLAWAPIIASESFTETSNPEFVIPESEAENFTADPVAYICGNFNIKEHPAFAGSEKEPDFYVTFRCAKGYLVAKYDRQGDLISTRQRFKNITLPTEIMAEIYRDYKGWEVTDIDYKATGIRESIKKEHYRIQLKKEDQEMVIKKKIKHTS